MAKKFEFDPTTAIPEDARPAPTFEFDPTTAVMEESARDPRTVGQTFGDFVRSNDGFLPEALEQKVAQRQEGRDTPIEMTKEMISQNMTPAALIRSIIASGGQVPLAFLQTFGGPALAGAERVAESAIAGTLLEAQKGSPETIPAAVGKALTGQSKAELGDVFYGAGAPEPLAATAGLLSSMAIPDAATGFRGAQAISRAARKTPQALAKVGTQAVDVAKRAVTPPSIQQQITTAIKRFDDTADSVQQSLRPTVKGRRMTAAERGRINTDIKTVAQDIADNKSAIQYTDESGTVIDSGRVPESLYEASQAQTQRMQQIFDQWDEIAARTQSAGGRVDLSPVKRAMSKFASDTKKISSPRVRARAMRLMKSLDDVGSLTPRQLQEALVDINQDYGRYWANRDKPMYTFIKDYHDAMMEALDTTIKRAGNSSEEYRQLRQLYRAHKNIQQDINKRMWIYGRKARAQLPDMLNMFSAGDFVQGAFRTAAGDVGGGISQIMRGAAQNQFARWVKRINSPDNDIRKLFRAADEYASIRPRDAEIVQDIPAGPTNRLTAAQEPLALPDLPTGPRQPTNSGGVDVSGGVIEMPNQRGSGVIAGESPEAVERRSRPALTYQRQPGLEPWQYTRDDVIEALGDKPAPNAKREVTLMHRELIKNAIRRGEDVPEDVIKAYPDIYRKWQRGEYDNMTRDPIADDILRRRWDKYMI